MKSPYILTISLHVLEQLGINLYSNIPAVLSEAVANAWDADATEVSIDVDRDNKTITIIDNGSGMTQKELNERFLTVGYQRRKAQSGLTKLGRRPMGRKGIGKLSLFSIAEVVDVFTATKGGSKDALRMDINEIRKKVGEIKEDDYYPKQLEAEKIDFPQGTRIVLSKLTKSRIHTEALKRRLARRFSIIGEKRDFQVKVDGHLIAPSDRGYFKSLRYIWTFGENEEVKRQCVKLDGKNGFNPKKTLKEEGIEVTGWIGAVHHVRQLKDEVEDGDSNLNRIAIYARGKMMQEDILDDFGKRGVFSSYLAGELEVKGLDEYDGKGTPDSDAATASRQKIVEDDPRYKKLCALMSKEVSQIGSAWRKWRGEKGLELAKSIPAVQEWLTSLSKDDKKKADAWLSKVGAIQGDDLHEKKRLLKHAVIAFEFYKANKNLESLESFNEEGLDVALVLFNTLDEFENSLYGQIVRNRIGVIKTLQKMRDENSVEKAIQKHIYDHLWLIDSSWERTTSDDFMEKTVKKIFADVASTLTDEEKRARLDIGYRLAAGKHIIVELKRPEKVLKLSELTTQIQKYRTALLKALDKSKRSHEPVEFICVLGKEPKEQGEPKGPETVEKAMNAYDARVVYYDKLLSQAYQSYQDYLNATQKSDKLAKLVEEIEDFSIGSDQEET